MTALRQRWRQWLHTVARRARVPQSVDERERACIESARALVAAVDRGGIPLNTLRVNQIARDLGLEVSRHARPGETIERIRAALQRQGGA
jgi:alpha-D-ribose 1-methylphosphonate 5-triphosphate synthase subunit PhnI